MTTGLSGQAPDLDTVHRVTGAVRRNIEKVIAGKPDVVNAALVVLVAEGHLLIEDVPGVGKTQLSKALARSIDCSVRRIQFTPDLLPSDVTGVSVFNQDTREFEFRPGGVFANIVVGDEINRASPKTQSALLEVMEESRVTVDGVTHEVGRPFLVIATQNPIEQAGTYKLPEAQLDRFLIKTSLGYPDSASTVEILAGAKDRTTGLQAKITTKAVADMADNRPDQPFRRNVVGRGLDGGRQVRHRDTDIGHQPRRTGPQRKAGVIGAVPHPPQPGAIFRRSGPVKALGAELCGDFTKACGILADGAGRSVELDHQMRLFRQVGA